MTDDKFFEDNMTSWFQSLAEREANKTHEYRQGRPVAGTEPCPKCGDGLVNDRCLSCGYDKNIVQCAHCGADYPKGESCGKCGWSTETPLCRNCNADLIPSHIVRKQLEDDWAWKCCAYCGWPIERYLYRITDLRPYIKPYDDDEGHGLGISFASVVFAFVATAFFAAVILPFIGNIGSHAGFVPNANLTGNQAVNGTSTINAITGVPILQLMPLVFIMLFVVFGVKMFTGASRGL